MTNNAYKLHTNTWERMHAILEKAMYGITKKTFRLSMPDEFHDICEGDLIFVSELKANNNVLFGPFYVVAHRDGIVGRQIGTWMEVDERKSDPQELAYWVSFEKYNYCLLFDKLLAQTISIVWPHEWKELMINLPGWGKINNTDSEKLVEFCLKKEHQVNVQEFLRNHSKY